MPIITLRISQEIDTDGARPPLLVELARVELGRDRFEEAEQLLHQAVAADPTDADAWRWLGHAQYMEVGASASVALSNGIL